MQKLDANKNMSKDDKAAAGESAAPKTEPTPATKTPGDTEKTANVAPQSGSKH
jgi:hypothetical protein